MTVRVRGDTAAARGSALISAVVLLVLVGIAGIVVLHATRIEVLSSVAAVRSKEAFYMAVAGLETARDELRLRHSSLDDAWAAAAGPNGAIDFSPDALRAVYDAGDRPIGFSGYGDDVPLRPFTVLADGAYAVFITHDGAGASGRVLLTAVGVGRDRSFETVQAIVEATTDFPMREIEHRKR